MTRRGPRSPLAARLGVAGALALGLSAALGPARAQPGAVERVLRTGGERASFGVHAFAARADPLSVPIVSGGTYDARVFTDAPNVVPASCRGFVMLVPDVILRVSGPPSALRLSVQASGDTTLLVHPPDGRWACDDDGGPGANPRVVFERPLEGRYDVWVGSYHPEQNHRGRLQVE